MLASILTFLAEQPIFTGMVGAMLTGGALFAARQVPARIFTLLREHLTVTLIVDSGEDTYDELNVWLARSRKARRTRRLMMQEGYDYDQGRWATEFTLGAGWHLLIHRRRLVVIHRHVPQAEALDKLIGSGRRHRLTLTSMGRSQAPIRSLVEEARRTYNGDGLVAVFFYNQGGFMMADKRPARDFSTVYLPPAQKQRLRDRLTAFLASRDEYRRRAIPWRLGVLLEGPPGTGKTTLIFALASLVGRSVYVINLNNIGGDNELMAAFNHVGANGVIALEDVDTSKITVDREAKSAPAPAIPTGHGVAVQADEQKGVTLSGLLNAIDGVAAREGRILFMTSNHADQLDKALVRPGRVDLRETIDRLGADEAWAMYRAFRPDGSREAFRAMVAGRLPISAAELQNRLLAAEPIANDDAPRAWPGHSVPIPQSPRPPAIRTG